MEGKELSRAKIIEKKIRKLLEIDAEVELKGLGTRRVIEIIVKDIMEGKRALTFDPKQGRLFFIHLPSAKIQKCFYCSNDAIAICNSCSPTSSTGLTKPKPLCADCIVNGIGINILHWLIPEDEAEKLIQNAIEKRKAQNK